MKKYLLFYLLLLALGACGENSRTENQGPAPVIEAIETEYDGKAVFGEPVIIKGSNFSPELSENSIKLKAGYQIKMVQPIEASENELSFEAPTIVGTTMDLTVVSGGKSSNTVTLEYDQRLCDSLFLMDGAVVKKLRDGVSWTNIYKIWDGSIRSINILTIEPSETNRLAIAYPSKNALTSEQCKQHGAFLGVNGSFFNHTYVKVDGRVMQIGKDAGVEAFRHDGVFTLDNNVPGIQYVGSNANAAKLSNENVLCCGPLLINNNKNITQVEHTFNTTTHPRTGVAITEDGKVLLVTVDGRFEGLAVGMPTTLFARLFDAFGAEYALNLDGGGSTTMWIDGYGLVNHPCDNKNWENPVEREVQSIIYMK